MPRELVLSVGLHKTGTTSIQKTCSRNAPALLDAGFQFPEFAFKGQPHTNHTAAFHYMFRDEPDGIGFSSKQRRFRGRSDAAAISDRYKAIVASRLLTQPTSLLMVAEGVSVFTVDELQAMKTWFGDRGWSIKVICFVRWLSSWINSMISQRVTGFQHLTIKAAVGEYLDAPGAIRPRIANVRAVFPDAKFCSFEAASKHERGLVGFFFETIGIRRTESMVFERANEGRSDCATRLVSSINEALGPGYVDGMVNRQYADNRVAGLNAIHGPRFSLRPDEVAPLLPRLIAENEWLNETLGEQFYDRHLEFGSEPCVWTEERLARLREILGTATPAVRSLVASHMAGLGLDTPAQAG